MGRRSILFLLLLAVSTFSSVNGAPSAQCYADILAYQIGLGTLESWALKMLDSSSKLPPEGILQGSFLFQLGNFDECLSVKGPLNSDNEPRFNGKYCRVQLGFKATNKTDPKSQLLFTQMKLAYDKISNGISFKDTIGMIKSLEPQTGLLPDATILAQWAVCAPSSCTADGVKIVADFNLRQFFSAFNLDIDTAVIEGSCQFEGDGKQDLDTGSWAFVIFFLTLTLAMVFATIFDYVWPKGEDLHVAVQAFSLRTNLRNLYTLPKSAAPGQLTCLHGIRVFSTWWIILIHCFTSYVFLPHINARMAIETYLFQWSMAPLYNASLAVDTFFFLSGLLTVYLVLLDQKKGRSFNFFKFILYRYLRISLPLAAMIFYLATLHKRAGVAPMWDLCIEPQSQICGDYWWVSLLYFANFYKPAETMCMAQAWYLMVEMQLAVLTPIVIYPLLKWPIIGLGIIGALTLGSIAMTFGLTLVYNFPWTVTLIPVESTADFGQLISANPAARAAPYLCGMALAYVLANKITFKLPKWGVVLEWILNSAACLAIVYSIMIVNNKNFVYDNLEAAFYASLHRFGWAVGLSWIVWACVNGYGGPVNSILSWKYFLPLSKLSYCAFLVHIDEIFYHIALNRTETFFSIFEIVFEFFGTLIMMIPATMWLYLAVDAPCQTIIRVAFGKANRSAAGTQSKDKLEEEKEEEPTPEKKAEESQDIKSDN
ncbi:nose resistant to fluoxetine protein 6-like [Cloeon dipterum]|uniref:nose resistant to fluoxetine protein 6-like n=1 Tax=Cloeon dipterum TaxID=197152 RepID=UPI0032205436